MEAQSSFLVGELPNYTEEQVNELIQKYLHSDILKQQKKRIIDFLKESIKQRFSLQ